MSEFFVWAKDHGLVPAIVGGLLGIFPGLPFLRFLSNGDKREIARLRGEVFMHKALAESEKRMSTFYRDLAQRAFDVNHNYTVRVLGIDDDHDGDDKERS